MIRPPHYTSAVSARPTWQAVVLLALGGALLQPAMAAPEEAPMYEGVIKKIFDNTCLTCHTADKKRGKLEMTSLELITKGGGSELPGLVPGNSGESEVFKRMTLPADHDDHMPPSDKPQPKAEEIALLKWWIDAGAKPEVALKDAGVPEELKPVALALAALVVEPPKEAPKPVIAPKELDEATKAAIAQISSELGVTILQLSQSDTGLMFTAVNVADKFDDAALAKLAPLAPHLVDVNLARTRITDAGLATVAAMSNLQRLRLENTAITDAALDHLQNLQNLEYLNLFHTEVTDAGLAKLAGLSKLTRLYAWETKATKEGAEKLHAANNALIINLGWDLEIGRPIPAPAPAPAPEPAPAAEATIDPEAVFFASRIVPVLERTCYSCHGEEKQRGGFAAHTFEALSKGGKDGGPGIVPGKPEESSVLARILLPADHDDHMPPEGKPQPTEKEIALFKWWIAQGADAQKKNKEVELPAELK